MKRRVAQAWRRVAQAFRPRWRRRTLAAGIVIVSLGAARYWPLPVELIERSAAPGTLVLDRHGVTLYAARNADGMRGDPVDARALPAHVVEATLAAEDSRFRRHPGIDPLAIARSLWVNARYGGGQGGSTLTQQVARMLLDRDAGRQRPRTIGAKIRESLLAWRLEGRRTKDEILSLYLTLAPYGNQIAGIRRASLEYFGVEPAQLTPAQAAYLAALPQQPSRFNPRADATRAVARAHWILRRMAQARTLDGATLASALAERVTPAPASPAFLAPHFVQMVLAARPTPAARIVTTIDARLQRDIEGIVAAHRPQLDAIGARHAAVVVLDNRTGEWLAWEGSGNFSADDGGAINGAASPRQPGSALKPFTYALAFESGYDPASLLPDIPTEFPTAEQGVSYRPENYDGRYRGPMLARAALAGSENIPAVALAADIGIPRLQRMLARAGFTTFDRSAAHYGLGLTLGNAEVRLDELVAAYAGIARGGVRRETVAVREIDGHSAPRDEISGSDARFVSYRTAWWVTDILTDADARAYAFGRGNVLEFPFPVAVKTGTSQAYRDNWVVGYTRDVTVGVWVGNFDRTPLIGSSGISGAGPIFQAAMLAAVEHAGRDLFDMTPILATPDDVERREICLLSGMAAGAACPRRGLEWTRAGRRPSCSWHAHEGAAVVTRWPNEYHRWAAAEGFDVSSVVRASSTPARATGFRIVTPMPDAVYLIDPTLRAEFQSLPLTADGASGEVQWTIDGRDAGRSDAARPFDWPLAPGRHAVVARDSRGRTARVNFVVR